METLTTVVTGAFGYSGRAIARRLLERGHRVLSLTRRPVSASPFGDRVAAAPLCFEDPEALAETLRGADALVNTYWVRFERGETTHARAVKNTRRLIDAAVAAGVRRLVHVSITNPDEDSPLSYFRGKALLERAVRESGISHAILRPAVLFGGEDVLINNIAWLLRRLPLFGVPGFGRYGIQPIHVDDLAAMAVAGVEGTTNVTMDAVGPETFRFIDLVRRIRDAVAPRTPVVPMPKTLVWLAGRIAGRFLDDVVLTWPEIRGLTAGLLVSRGALPAPTPLTTWLSDAASTLGQTYANELTRHFQPRGQVLADK